MTQPDLQQWTGRTTEQADQACAAPIRLLAATLDRDLADFAPGGVVPPLGHWTYFLPGERHSGIGPDGHPLRGGFLPPVDLPRRMWAGSQLTFHRDIAIGAGIRRVSRIADVSEKQGSTGALVFVKVAHEVHDDAGLAISEVHDIVYREAPAPGQPPAPARPSPVDEQFARAITPDPVLLFRYSALTFNGHRIHYDQPYVTQVEGYPGLIVHGPLIATLLLDNLRRAHPGARIEAYEFRAVSPLFCTGSFEVCGRVDGSDATLWARTASGTLAMQAKVSLPGFCRASATTSFTLSALNPGATAMITPPMQIPLIGTKSAIGS